MYWYKDNKIGLLRVEGYYWKFIWNLVIFLPKYRLWVVLAAPLNGSPRLLHDPSIVLNWLRPPVPRQLAHRSTLIQS